MQLFAVHPFPKIIKFQQCIAWFLHVSNQLLNNGFPFRQLLLQQKLAVTIILRKIIGVPPDGEQLEIVGFHLFLTLAVGVDLFVAANTKNRSSKMRDTLRIYEPLIPIFVCYSTRPHRNPDRHQ